MGSSFKVDLVNSVFIGPINSTWDPQKSNKNTQRPLENAIQTKYVFGYTSAVDVCASYIYIYIYFFFFEKACIHDYFQFLMNPVYYL